MVFAPLILLNLAHAQDASAVAALQRVSGLPRAVVLRRIPAEGHWDLVVALASGGFNWWNSKDRLGILLQNREAPDQVDALSIAPGPNDDCITRVERFTTQELVMSCVGEKWATYANQKFVYDVHTRKLVSRFAYAPFATERAVPGVGFVMTNKERELLVEVDGEPRVSARGVPRSMPEAGIFQVTKDAVNGHRLPQTDSQTWQKARPDDAKTYTHIELAEVHEEIGPYQAEGGRLWFGKTFYNSEGGTGLGGFGYFDAAGAAFHLIAPPELYPWSVSAILVEPDAIWLALYRRGEYGNSPGGLLRWDRKAATVRHFDVPWIATAIMRSGDGIFLGATDGVVALRGDRLTRYFVDRAADGQYRLAAQ